jgi:hypothetical protein
MTLAHMLARFREAIGAESKHEQAAAAKKEPRRMAVRVPQAPAAGAHHAALPRPIAQTSEAVRRRIRERYLAVRFPGAPHSDSELQDNATVIKAARLYFEDGDIDRACELLEFAADANAADELPWLAHLEILYLKRKGPAYTALAKRFHERFPQSGRWPEILRLGLRLEPEEPLYRLAHPHEALPDEHYGAWPQVQNWIQAPFDLTGDVLAAEFHAKMRGGEVPAPITAKASGK